MPVPLDATQSIVNAAGLGGTQSNARIGTFANGSFVVAWQDDPILGAPIRFQMFNADGSARGAVVSAGQQGTLHDLAVSQDGRFTVAVASGTGANFTSFDAVSLATTGAVTFISANSVTGAQIVPRGGNVLDVLFTTNANLALEGAISTSGDLVETSTTLAFVNSGATEAVAGSASGSMFGLAGGTLTSSDGTTLNLAALAPTDLIKISSGFHVLASSSAGSNQLRLTGLFGAGDNLATYTLGQTVGASGISGTTSGTAETLGHELIDLGNGRILGLFASFRALRPLARWRSRVSMPKSTT